MADIENAKYHSYYHGEKNGGQCHYYCDAQAAQQAGQAFLK
jgi:hypothetical protein